MNTACQIHGSAVAFNQKAVLITGAAGSGKSTLALELIALGAKLIADDRVDLTRAGDSVLAAPPSTIAGTVEARGVGLIDMDHVQDVPVAWIVDLDQAETERLPHSRTRHLLDVPCPVILGKERAGLAPILWNLFMFGLRDIDEI